LVAAAVHDHEKHNVADKKYDVQSNFWNRIRNLAQLNTGGTFLMSSNCLDFVGAVNCAYSPRRADQSTKQDEYSKDVSVLDFVTSAEFKVAARGERRELQSRY
jgi:hypothetical protein